MADKAPLGAIDIVVLPPQSGAAALARLAQVRTRLVQGLAVGFEGIAGILPPGLVYANAAGVHDASTAELAMALILASQRGVPDFVRAANDGRWSPAPHPSLADRTALLIGYGGLGKAIEARLLPFETTVVRVARTARADERGAIHGIESLPELLPQADVVVVAVPLTEATMRLVDDSFLSRMRDGSLMVNISRGMVVDTNALISHATTGRLRFALDVTDPEPLPNGHTLFGLPNVLISPHVGGMSSAMLPRLARLVSQQIDRMQRDEEPLNVVIRS